MNKWNEKYTLHNANIDEQHSHLFDLAHRIEKSECRSETFNCAMDLFKHINVHFKDEEQLMRQVNFPGLDEHASAHFNLLTKFVAITQRLTQTLAHHELHDFMQNHFLKHTFELDMLFGKFLSQQQSSPIEDES